MISDEVIVLRNRTLSYFPGNLSEYESNTRKTRKAKMKMRDAQDKQKQAIKKSIEEGRKAAKKTGDENRTRMIKSRQKKLDDRWGLERSDKGTRLVIPCLPKIQTDALCMAMQVQTQQRSPGMAQHSQCSDRNRRKGPADRSIISRPRANAISRIAHLCK